MTLEEIVSKKNNMDFQNALKEHFFDGKNEADIEDALEWKKLNNQITSGLSLGLSYEQICIYAVSYADKDYKLREFIKTCMFEGIDTPSIERMCKLDTLDKMKEIKVDYYKSNAMISAFDGKIRTLQNTVSDCEGKFDVFEKAMDNFLAQIEAKNQELEEARRRQSELFTRLIAANDEIERLNKKLEGAAGKEIIINKIAVKDAEEEVKVKPQFKKTKKMFSIFKKKEKAEEEAGEENTSEQKAQEQPQPETHKIKYVREQKNVQFTSLESYIMNANLDNEQLRELTKAIEAGIEENYIVEMIENKCNALQIRASVQFILARKKNNQTSSRSGNEEAAVKKADEEKAAKESSFVDMNQNDPSDEDDDEGDLIFEE